MLPSATRSTVPPPPAYDETSEAGICLVVLPSITMNASVSAIVIDDVDFAEPSSKSISSAVASIAANLVKSACTRPDTLSSRFNSAAVVVTATPPISNLSFVSFTSPANVDERSSLIVSAVARAFKELPDPPALAVWNTISPPAPEPPPYS